MSPLDLHVLSTPPAFVLSQDQTLMFNPYPSSSTSAAPLNRSFASASSLLPYAHSPKSALASTASVASTALYSRNLLTVLPQLFFIVALS